MSGVPDAIAELGPAVIIRAALFPIGDLLSLQDPEVAQQARALDPKAASVPADFETAYERSIERQRTKLAALTLDDPRFSRALSITNEALSRLLSARGGLPARRTKRARHLETTLYRYLARAVWRTDPCDLWTGVAIGEWAEASTITSRRARYAFAPDLRPYQTILKTLAGRPDVARCGRFKVNPTLWFDADRKCWRYQVRTFNSTLAFVEYEKASRPWLDLVVRRLEHLPPRTLDELAMELHRGSQIDPSSIPDVLNALQTAGVLVGGLTFPVQFSSPWDALLKVARELSSEHARLWRASIFRVRRVCRRLERHLDALSVPQIHAALEQARDSVLELARALEVAPPLVPRSVLRCDCLLPFSVSLGPAAKTALEKAVAEFHTFDARHGIDAAARAAHRAFLLREPSETGAVEVEGSGQPTFERACKKTGDDPCLAERIRRWSLWLQSGGTDCRVDLAGPDPELPLPPVSALILRPSRTGFAITGTTAEVAATYGRYGQLWTGLGRAARRGGSSQELHRWYCSTLASVAQQAAVDIVEYCGPFEPSPNGLSRPAFGFPVWDRWGTTSPFRVGTTQVEGSTAAVFAYSEHPRPLVVACFSPLNLSFRDPFLERLLLTSFREVPRWAWPTLPFEHELRAQTTSPRLRLPSGNVVQSRRTIVTGPALAALAKAHRAGRFLLWQALAQRHRWPALLLVSRDGAAALPVPRDSPLAVEAVFEGLNENATSLCVEEADDHGWLVDDQERAFVTQLIVPFLRHRHAWSHLAPGQRAAASS